jgi:endonuclease III
MRTRKSRSVKAEEARLRRIEAILRETYGSPLHYNPTEPLDDLIFLVLSRMTQEVKYRRTYAALRESMPDWGIVRDAPSDELEDLLSDAGLAPTKTSQIQAILKEVEQREGKLDLGRLRTLGDEEVEQYLTSLPGVGRKTARCVMLYALGRQTCPVDTHVWRVMRRLEFAEDTPWSESRAQRLEESIPRDLRTSLHLVLVAHGRVVCRARHPACHTCSIATYCPVGRHSRSQHSGAQ